jgi:hypothetical protein
MRVTGQGPSSGSNIVLTSMDLSDADLSHRKVNYFTAVSSRFTRCDFSGMQVSRGGSFGGGGDYTEYVDCMFDQAAFVHVLAGRATFSRCMFRDVKIRHLFSHEGEFIDCLFTGRIKTAVFNGQPQQHGIVPNPKALLRFTGNDFSGAVLEDVGFRTGIDLSRQLLPEGEDYILQLRSEPVLRRAWEIAEALPLEDPRRRGLRAALRVQLDKLNDGQEDLFLSLVNRKDAAGGQALKEVLTQAQVEV